MTPETMPETEGPENERFVSVATAAGVEALRRTGQQVGNAVTPIDAHREEIQTRTRIWG
jgi:hypothetical protein